MVGRRPARIYRSCEFIALIPRSVALRFGTLITGRAYIPMTRRHPYPTSLRCHLAEQFECVGTADLTLPIAVRQHDSGIYGIQPAFEGEVDGWLIVTYECPCRVMGFEQVDSFRFAEMKGCGVSLCRADPAADFVYCYEGGDVIAG